MQRNITFFGASIGYLQPSAPQLYTKVVFTQQIKRRLWLKTYSISTVIIVIIMFGFKSKYGHNRAFTCHLKIGQRSSIMHKICGIHLQGNIKLPDICHFLLCWMVVWLCCGDGEDLLVLVGKWADPGGTAMPGQPVTRPEQAPEPHPLAKISLISKGAHGPRIRY